MTPKELEKMPLRVERLFYDMQNRIIDDIVRRIQKTGGITSTADYQIEKLSILGNSTEFIESEIKKTLKASYPEMWELYDDVVNKDYTRNKALYEQVNANFIQYKDNNIMQGWVKAIVEQTQNELENFTRSMGFVVDIGGGKTAFAPFSKYYQEYLDKACLDIVTGSFDYNTVLRRTVKDLVNSGIRYVDYSTGRRVKAIGAARTAIMTGVSQLSQEINKQIAKDLDSDSFEVTWHPGARPTHWWGGRVYTYAQLEEICKLNDVAGLCGANCYHSYHAFVPGASVRTFTDKQLDEMNAKEQEVKKWKGKEYNAYAATKEQRALERLMRDQRSMYQFLRRGGADPDKVMAEQANYLSALHNYQRFSKKMGLDEQMERVYMDGLGRVAPRTTPRYLKAS